MTKQYNLNWYEKYGIEILESRCSYEEFPTIESLPVMPPLNETMVYEGIKAGPIVRIEPSEIAFAIPNPTEEMQPILENIEKHLCLSAFGYAIPLIMRRLLFDGYLVDVRSLEKLKEMTEWSSVKESSLLGEIQEKRAILKKRIICVNRISWEYAEDAGWTSFYRRVGFGIIG
jgi:hypothetical protein